MKRRPGVASASNLSRDELRVLERVTLAHTVKLRAHHEATFEGGYHVAISREVLTFEAGRDVVEFRIAELTQVTLDYETGVLLLEDVGMEVVCQNQATISALRRILLSMVEVYEDGVRQQRQDMQEEAVLLHDPVVGMLPPAPAAEDAGFDVAARNGHVPPRHPGSPNTRFDAPVPTPPQPQPPNASFGGTSSVTMNGSGHGGYGDAVGGVPYHEDAGMSSRLESGSATTTAAAPPAPTSPLAATGMGPGRGSVKRASLPPHNTHSNPSSVRRGEAGRGDTVRAPSPSVRSQSQMGPGLPLPLTQLSVQAHAAPAGGGGAPQGLNGDLPPAHPAYPPPPPGTHPAAAGAGAPPPTFPPQGSVYEPLHTPRGSVGGGGGGAHDAPAPPSLAPASARQSPVRGASQQPPPLHGPQGDDVAAFAGGGGFARHQPPPLPLPLPLPPRGGSVGSASAVGVLHGGGQMLLPPPPPHGAAGGGVVVPATSPPPPPPPGPGALVEHASPTHRAAVAPAGTPRDTGAVVAGSVNVRAYPPLTPPKLDKSLYPLPPPATDAFPTLGPAITQTRMVDLVQEPSTERGKLLLLLAKDASGASLVAAYNGHPEVELYIEMWATADLTPAATGVTRTTHPQYNADVFGLVVQPGETKEFVSGNTKGDPQPGWKTQPLSDDSLTRRRKALEQKVFDDYQRLQALVDPDAPEARVLEVAMEKQVPFIDLWFLPQPSSLAKPHEQEGQAQVAEVETWGRPAAYLPPGQTPGVFVAPPAPNDIDVGVNGHAWLPCLIACLAEYATASGGFNPLERMFSKHKAAYAAVGAWRLVMCREGWWRDVVVDDYLPLIRRPKRSLLYGPAYTHNITHRRETWAAAVEKAYARLAGSYASVGSGYFHEGLMDLTGFPAERVAWEETRDTTLWDDLFAHMKSGAAMLVLNTPNAGPDPQQAETYEKNHLMLGYGYHVLQFLSVGGHRLVRVRNPWRGVGRWGGRWADDSSNWANNPAVAAAARFEGGNDGTVWLAWPEVLDWFDGCTVLHYIPQAGEVRLALPFQNALPGYVLELTVKTPTKVFVGVHLKDQRNKPNPAPYGCMNVTVLQKAPGAAGVGGEKTATGQWQRLHEDYEWGSKDFLGVYSFNPEGGTYLICVHDYDGGTDGGRITDDVVVSLHYMPQQANGPSVEGTITMRNSAAVIDAIQYNPVIIKDALTPVEAYAQVRRHIASQESPSTHQLMSTVHL